VGGEGGREGGREGEKDEWLNGGEDGKKEGGREGRRTYLQQIYERPSLVQARRMDDDIFFYRTSDDTDGLVLEHLVQVLVQVLGLGRAGGRSRWVACLPTHQIRGGREGGRDVPGRHQNPDQRRGSAKKDKSPSLPRTSRASGR